MVTTLLQICKDDVRSVMCKVNVTKQVQILVIVWLDISTVRVRGEREREAIGHWVEANVKVGVHVESHVIHG